MIFQENLHLQLSGNNNIIEEHTSCFLYLWNISTDTDLLSDDDCVHKCFSQKYKNQS